MLTIADVCKLSGIEPQTLRNWIAAGLIKPAMPGGVGKNNGHLFSVMQTVGLVVAEQVRQSERSCALSYVAAIVEAFGAMPEANLVKELKAGRTRLQLIHKRFKHSPGQVILASPPKQYDDMPDVKAAFERVTKFVEKQQRKE